MVDVTQTVEMVRHARPSVSFQLHYNSRLQLISCSYLPSLHSHSQDMPAPTAAVIFVDDQDPEVKYLCPSFKQKVAGAYYEDTWTSPQKKESCGTGWFQYTFYGEFLLGVVGFGGQR